MATTIFAPEGLDQCAPEGLDQCAICYEEMKKGSLVKGHDNHLFHVECLDRWILEKNNCPICRKNFNTNLDYARENMIFVAKLVAKLAIGLLFIYLTISLAAHFRGITTAEYRKSPSFIRHILLVATCTISSMTRT